jgi:FecR protein
MKTLSRLLTVCFAFVLGLPALAGSALADDGGYGYFRVVEGTATVAPADAGADESNPAEVNQPILAGDRLSVSSSRSRVEIVLADQNILRVDGKSELVFERLAASPDRDDRATVVRLLNGNVQLIVTQDSLGDELPRIETPNASIYAQDYGTYRVTSDQGWTQLVVRRGSAQVVTDSGSSRVRADEEAVIDDQDPDRRADIREAGAFDTLERWGRQLDDEYASADLGDYVDDNLRYQAAPLARYGAWVTINGGHYWRPRVDASWRPYWHGRWVYTPAGMTWVSSEPWGWVPYHYGSWDYVPDYGWVWQPGYVWSPAWVYWYWGPSYVGWCPTGYYTRYYGPEFGSDVGFRWGVYGWAGGSWDLFDRWSFVSTSYFDYGAGYRQGYRDGYWDAHRDVQRFAIPIDRHGRQAIERGIITTDTKPLKPSVFRDRGEVLQVLRGRHQGELQDVTPFVARTPKPKLPPAVITSVVADKPQVLDGTPLRPGTLGKPDRRPRGERSSVFGGDPGKPGVTGAAPAERNPAVGRPAPGDRQVRPGRPGPQADGGAPRPAPGGDRGERSDRNGRPAVGQPSVQGGQPSVQGGQPAERERPGRRPAPEAQGGAPKPDRQDRQDRQPVDRERPPSDRPSVFGGQPDRPSKPQTEERRPPAQERQPSEERRPPADRERSVRPAPEAQDAAPKPERRPVVQPKPERQERPEVRENRPPERRPEVQERRQPEPKPEPQRQPERRQEERKEDRKPAEDKKPPR